MADRDIRARLRRAADRRTRALQERDAALDELAAVIDEATSGGMGIAEAARIVGISRPAVYELLRRARPEVRPRPRAQGA